MDYNVSLHIRAVTVFTNAFVLWDCQTFSFYELKQEPTQARLVEQFGGKSTSGRQNLVKRLYLAIGN